jgi:putative two-component system response regulator
MLTEEEAMVFANRLSIATPKRMLELLFHYGFPRLFCVIVVSVLASGISRRTGKMLNRQVELAEKVREEMRRHSTMQTRVIDDLSALIETRDVGTGEHVIRTKEYVRMIAKEMQKRPKYADILTDPVIDEIVSAAPLHDVGKIAISDVILLKPGKLTKEEFDEMKKHTVKGGDMIQNIFSNLEDPSFLETAREIAVSHHEKWDGSGYPAGLKGEEIPISARIMAVADVFDALVSKRTYKDPMSPESAFDILEEETGTHFDPDIMSVVFDIRDDFIAYSRTPVGR